MGQFKKGKRNSNINARGNNTTTEPHIPLASRARIVVFGLEMEGMHWRMEVA